MAILKSPLETGGVLMGYRQDDCVVVTACIGPGPFARHTSTTFEPDYTYQDQAIADLYRASGNVTTYLGDWHSHPQGALSLSKIDKRTLRRISNHIPARLNQPVMLILAGGEPWRVGAWAWWRMLTRFVGKADPLEVRVFKPDPAE